MIKVLITLSFTIAYLDDIIIYSRNAEEHLEHLQHVFHEHSHAELSMKLSKCHLFSKELQYFGPTGIQPLPSKTAAIKQMRPSKC